MKDQLNAFFKLLSAILFSAFGVFIISVVIVFFGVMVFGGST